MMSVKSFVIYKIINLYRWRNTSPDIRRKRIHIWNINSLNAKIAIM